MNRLQTQVPDGTMDYLPDECYAKRQIEQRLRERFIQEGYREIETPAFEYYEVFTHDSVPYVQENMIKFFDLRGRILALRPDMTGPIARAAATKLLSTERVLRLFYIANAYGFLEKPNLSKTEFTQAGVELIGKRGSDADAEVIAVAIESLLGLGLNDFKIDLGQVDYFMGLIEDTELTDEQKERVRRLIDTKNSVELEYELSNYSIDRDTKNALLSLGTLFGNHTILTRAEKEAKNGACAKAVENIREVYQILSEYGYGKYLSIDFGILNDFNYYSGIIFRGIMSGIGTPLLSGGRYDRLLKEFGAEAAGIGFAMGIKELLAVLEQRGLLPYNKEKVMVLKVNRAKRGAAYAYARKLREQGAKVIMDTDGNEEYDADRYRVVIYDQVDAGKE